MVWLWPAALIPAYLFAKRKKGRGLLCSCLAVILTLAVSYSYTLIRADRGVLLARTAPVLIAVAGMFFGISLLREASLPNGFLSVMTGLCLSLPVLCYAHVNDMKTPYLWTYPNGNDALVAEDVSKLFACYEVPEGFSSMTTLSLSDPSNLGPGYMAADQFHYLSEYDTVKRKMEAAGYSDRCYMGYDGQGFYYYLNTKACATGYLPVARSFEAQDRILNVVKKERPVIFPLDPQKSYYICRWLFSDEADYRYSSEDHCFYPSECFTAATGKTEGDLYAEEGVIDFGLICSHFGDSAESLLAVSTPALLLDGTSQGSDTDDSPSPDLLYLPLDTDALQKPVSVTISLDQKALCSLQLGNGDLIIPLGMHPDWLLLPGAAPEALSFTFTKEDGSETVLTLSEVTNCLKSGQQKAAGFYQIH